MYLCAWCSGGPGESVEIQFTPLTPTVPRARKSDIMGCCCSIREPFWKTFVWNWLVTTHQPIAEGALPVYITKAVKLAPSLAYQSGASKDESGLSGSSSSVAWTWMSGWRKWIPTAGYKYSKRAIIYPCLRRPCRSCLQWPYLHHRMLRHRRAGSRPWPPTARPLPRLLLPFSLPEEKQARPAESKTDSDDAVSVPVKRWCVVWYAGIDQTKERVVIVRDGPFICAVLPRQRGLRSSSQVAPTALAASALLLAFGFVVSAVAPPIGSWGELQGWSFASAWCF